MIAQTIDLIEVFGALGGLADNLSIDESVIPFYRKLHAKQYIQRDLTNFQASRRRKCPLLDVK